MGTLGCCSTSVPCTLRRVRQAPGGLALISRRPDPSVRSSRCLRTGRVSYPSSCCREVKRVRASPTEDSWGGDGEGLFAG